MADETSESECVHCHKTRSAHGLSSRACLYGSFGTYWTPADNTETKRLSMSSNCGGCRGEGSHRRWCEAVVGRAASIMGKQAQQASALGDSVGPNEMGAANHLWIASALLAERARQHAETWKAANETTT